jgi:acyl-CoA synthetase (AMP-forming)/AMP-acid ligase II
MPHNDESLWRLIARGGHLPERFFWGAEYSIALDRLVAGSSLDCTVDELAGRSVVIATADQLTAGLAVIELDGIARRLVLCPPDIASEHLPLIIDAAEAEFVLSDGHIASAAIPAHTRLVLCSPDIARGNPPRASHSRTEWILLTSGTTGLPKLVVHSLASLIGAIKPNSAATPPPVWSTFYDIRRYGGLQIFLRTALGGGSMVLSSAREATADFLARAGAHGVTHISGTPSHWRRALMSPSAGRIAPNYVRLSGEIADQAILDDLKAFYRDAGVGHAFASTEAGVAFEVNDGLAGFPAGLIGRPGAEVEMKIEDGSLRIRSARTATRYLGAGGALRDAAGFVDTGDMLDRRDGRYYFVGRRGGIINVGGLKVHPEEVEMVINRHPAVQMSLVRARKNPFTGAVVVADVVVRPDRAGDAAPESARLQGEILEACRRSLPAHKVPAAIRFVPSLDVGAAGKLARLGA